MTSAEIKPKPEKSLDDASSPLLTSPEKRRIREFAVKTLIVLGGVSLVGSTVGIGLINYGANKFADQATPVRNDIANAKKAVDSVQRTVTDAKRTFVDGACASIDELQQTQRTGDELKAGLDQAEAAIRGDEGITTTVATTAVPETDKYIRFIEACRDNG